MARRPFSRPGLLLVALLAALLLPACTVQHLNTTSASRYFPVGASLPQAETAWRVEWTFEPHPYKPGEEIWVITRADFMRGRTAGGQEDWIRVLDRMAVAAMFVPYVENSNRFRDFTGFYTGLSQLDNTAATRRAYRPTFIHGDRIVRETTDDFVRWIETGPGGYHAAARLRRGQAMTLWGMFSAYNYVYPMVFKFRDDGVIQVRIAASGQNLSSQPSASKAHLHMGAWRLEPHLCSRNNPACGADDVIVETVSRRDTGAQEEIVIAPFNGGVEGGEDWVGEEFTALLFTNPSQPNGRPIPCPPEEEPPCFSSTPVGYALIPIRYGVARYRRASEGFLEHDLWVTRRPVPPAPAEIFYTEVQSYANGEALAGHRKVVWHKSAFNHIPRFEDLGFGAGNAFSANQGIALAVYTGFDLVPRNLMFKTPLYTP